MDIWVFLFLFGFWVLFLLFFTWIPDGQAWQIPLLLYRTNLRTIYLFGHFFTHLYRPMTVLIKKENYDIIIPRS